MHVNKECLNLYQDKLIFGGPNITIEFWDISIEC